MVNNKTREKKEGIFRKICKKENKIVLLCRGKNKIKKNSEKKNL